MRRFTRSSTQRNPNKSECGAFVTVFLMCMSFLALLIALLVFIFHNMVREDFIERMVCPRPIKMMLQGYERSPDTLMTSVKNATCDSYFRQAWYRFDSPNGNMRMPERRMLPGMCNTGVPFWFYGAHPDNISLPMPAVACGALEDDGCKFYANIRVQHCGSYMAYYLQPLPKCYMAYCMEEFVADEGGRQHPEQFHEEREYNITEDARHSFDLEK
ncbi:uromodulin-like [Ornithodoros turicata]|uniref:uromodulin-like n=1 Tax=Ornithodoros turicata TaxID=34597 RepID=UPI003138A200